MKLTAAEYSTQLPLFHLQEAHGAAFRSRAVFSRKTFRWTSGEKLITWFESSPGTHRGFCSRCGSPLLSRFDAKPQTYGCR
jgi:hypothetical protein